MFVSLDETKIGKKYVFVCEQSYSIVRSYFALMDYSYNLLGLYECLLDLVTLIELELHTEPTPGNC